MVKSLALASILLIASIALAPTAVLLSFVPTPAAGFANISTYQNLTSINSLYPRDNFAMAVTSGNKTETILSEKIFKPKDFSTKTYRVNTNSSILNFFYSNTRTKSPFSVYSNSDNIFGLRLPEEAVGDYLLENDIKITRLANDAKLVIEQGRAVEFEADQTGRNLELKKSAHALKLALLAKKPDNIILAIHESAPQIKLADTNDLGITELISQGVSDFAGSSKARINNIVVGAAKYNGLIIKPGEQFSFNQNLGPVTASAGFLPELVIKAEGTIPEFGGGLCQVSSTAFRAAFFAGTQIDQRRNHSYAVKYYRWINDSVPASEGMDATIYPGVVDIKFTNDTPSAILISTKIKGGKLYFNFYGTSDGRRVEMDGPYTYDRQPNGALKAKVTRTVIKGEISSEDVFYSSYVSPDKYPRTYEYVENEEIKAPGEEKKEISST